MEVRDLALLQTLATAHRSTHRDIAKAAGYSSHSYVGRLMRGQVKAVEPTPAARIAHYFGVELGALFVPTVTGIPGKSDQRVRRAA